MAIYLRIIQGPGRGQVLPIPPQKAVSLGRSTQASYAFDDPLLSRKHCSVECQGDMCRIVDLQSRNGTYVNGQRIGAVLLTPGDRIKIGGILFEVCPAGAGAASLSTGAQGIQTARSGVLAPAPPTAAAPTLAGCQACHQPLVRGQGRELKGRLLCARCYDRFDVEEDLIEGFRLLERLDVTSFGTTYLAQQLLMERTVVLKTIVKTDGTDEVAVKRLLREARTGGRLTHPHIVELYDVNETEGMLYVVTEHVEGQSLERHMRERGGMPLPVPDVLRAMSQISEALAYAHEQGVVHRDVKPANVLIRKSDGLAKLQGFTLAKNLEGYSVITADGESLGTPYYMPPEQVRSAKNADFRSDIYSWGASTYHCVSGKLPLEARSYGEFIDKVFTASPPALDGLVPGAPRGLSELLGRCLERDPARRPQTIPDLRRELDPILRAL